MSNEIIEMKNKLYNYVIKLKEEFSNNMGVAKYRIKYLTALDIYNRIYEMNSVKSIEAYLDEILSKSNNQQKMHDELFAKYNSESNREIKNKIAVELNECTARLNAYNESYNIISKYYKKNISSKVTNPKIKERKPAQEKKEEVDKKEVKPEERKPIEEKAEERKPIEEKADERKPVTGKFEADKEDIALSNHIISLLEKYYELDKNTSEAKKIEEEVYNLIVSREEKFKELYGSKYRLYTSELESLELRAVITPKDRLKKKQLDCGNFIIELRNAINAINEYNFINELHIRKYFKKDSSLSIEENEKEYYHKYQSFVREFRVLIASLFKEGYATFKVNGEEVNTNDLISYLETCNLDGDYNVYKNKFSHSLIGNDEVNKKKYIESLLFLNTCITSLCNLVKEKIGDKKIDVEDNLETKEDIIKLRNDALKRFNNLRGIEFGSEKGKKL